MFPEARHGIGLEPKRNNRRRVIWAGEKSNWARRLRENMGERRETMGGRRYKRGKGETKGGERRDKREGRDS